MLKHVKQEYVKGNQSVDRFRTRTSQVLVHCFCVTYLDVMTILIFSLYIYPPLYMSHSPCVRVCVCEHMFVSESFVKLEISTPYALIFLNYSGYGARPFGTCPTVTSTGGPSQPILQPSGFRFQPQTNQQQANIPSYITSIPVSLQHISVVSGIPPATISSQSGKGDPHSLDGDVQGQLKVRALA